MQIENYLRLKSRHILFQRGIRGHKRNIKDLVSRLKAEKRYFSYPYEKYPPTIANYSFFSQIGSQLGRFLLFCLR